MIELIEYTCGSCQAPNRLQTQKLLRLRKSPACGKCGEPLFRSLEADLADLDPACYQHPLDKEALDKLRQIPGIRTLLRRVIRWTLELNLRLSQAANTVQLSERQMPEVYKRFVIAAERLGIEPVPELYVVQQPYPNASTYGVEQYFVTITTGALDLLDEEEQVAMFAHELGHIHSDHMLYKTAARFVSALASRLAAVSFGLGGLIALPLQLALLWWDRCAELTADRSALLAVRTPEVTLRMLMKMAGGTRALYPQMSFEAFMEQADHLDKLSAESGWARTLMFVQEIFRTHPFPVYRAKELVEWITSGNYLEIVDGDYRRKGEDAHIKCPACGRAVAVDALVCPGCGADPNGDAEQAQGPAAADGKGIDGIFEEMVGAAGDTVREAGNSLKGAMGEAAEFWRRNFEGRRGEGETSERDPKSGDDD